jgi:hypothetical protein
MKGHDMARDPARKPPKDDDDAIRREDTMPKNETLPDPDRVRPADPREPAHQPGEDKPLPGASGLTGAPAAPYIVSPEGEARQQEARTDSHRDVRAGPGDAGRTDAPRPIEDPARRSGRSSSMLMWGGVILGLLIVLFLFGIAGG